MFPNILAGERIKLGLLRDALKEFPIRQKTTVFSPQSPSSSNAPLPLSPSSSNASSAPLKRVPYCHKPQYSSKHCQNCPASAKCPGLHKPEIQLQKKQARENILYSKTREFEKERGSKKEKNSGGRKVKGTKTSSME